MPKLKIDQLQEGMVIAGDVKNMDGMLLLPVGCALAERQINILRAWGITEVNVEAASSLEAGADPLAKLPPDLAARLTAEIKGLFWDFDEGNPVQQEVFRLVLRRKARKCQPR